MKRILPSMLTMAFLAAALPAPPSGLMAQEPAATDAESMAASADTPLVTTSDMPVARGTVIPIAAGSGPSLGGNPAERAAAAVRRALQNPDDPLVWLRLSDELNHLQSKAMDRPADPQSVDVAAGDNPDVPMVGALKRAADESVDFVVSLKAGLAAGLLAGRDWIARAAPSLRGRSDLFALLGGVIVFGLLLVAWVPGTGLLTRGGRNDSHDDPAPEAWPRAAAAGVPEGFKSRVEALASYGVPADEIARRNGLTRDAVRLVAWISAPSTREGALS